VRGRCVAAGILVAALALVPAATAAESWVWLGYGHDTQLTNRVPSTSVTAESVKRLHLRWKAQLDGWIVASPLSTRVRVDGRSQQVVYATTEAGSVYAVSRETGDNDFGAAPLLFQAKGCPPLAAAKNKVGALFIWDRTHLADGPYARFELSDARSAFVGAPSYDPVRGTFFVSQAVIDADGPRYGVVAFQAVPECSLHPIWKTVVGAGDQPAPLVVGDVVFVPRGRLGGFSAMSAVNGHALWSFATEAQATSPMIEVAGTIVGGGRDGSLYGFVTGNADPLRPR
jgi:outer membrane protein assembly factor BamB